MKIMKFILLVKKCVGEARWNIRYKTWSEKKEIFKILFRLRYYTEISPRYPEIATQSIFGFHVSGTSYQELLYLFREIFLDGQYEFKYPGYFPTIIDCGANVGMAMLFFKRTYPGSKVVCFEPNPKVFALLQRNVNDNNLKDVQIINAGLSYKDGAMDFYVDASNTLISSIDKNRGGNKPIQVKMMRLSSVLKDNLFDFAKIDVEGAEWGVVNDLHQTNSLQNVNHYIFEYHHNMKDSTHKLSDFLIPFEQSGFSYNFKATFESLGDFQDVSISFFKKQ
jgi:FkbM family methyltransferase